MAQEKGGLVLCIDCGHLYRGQVKEEPCSECPKCGKDTPLVNQLPLSWIRDVMVTLVDAIQTKE